MDSSQQAELLRKLAQSETTKLARVDTPKASPLVNRTQSPVRVSGAPGAPPVASIGARSAGAPLNVIPPSTVDDVDHLHFHRHEGTTEKVKPYFHNHLHDHVVRHEPSDDGSGAHDERGHLSDARHVAALRGFGGWQAKSAGSTVEDIIKAGQADSREVQGLVTNRNISLTLINERLGSNAEAIRQLSTSAELAALRKATAPVDPWVRKLVDEQKELRAIHANAGGVTARAAQQYGVAVADLQRAAGAKIRKNAIAIRSIAGGEVDWDGRLLRKAASANVQKAYVTPAADVEKAKAIVAALKPALEKAFSGLSERIEALNSRAHTLPRKRL